MVKQALQYVAARYNTGSFLSNLSPSHSVSLSLLRSYYSVTLLLVLYYCYGVIVAVKVLQILLQHYCYSVTMTVRM